MLKPDFIFFGEAIVPENYRQSQKTLERADVLIIVGTTGEVMPASMLPFKAKATETTHELAKRIGLKNCT